MRKRETIWVWVSERALLLTLWRCLSAIVVMLTLILACVCVCVRWCCFFGNCFCCWHFFVCVVNKVGEKQKKKHKTQFILQKKKRPKNGENSWPTLVVVALYFCLLLSIGLLNLFITVSFCACACFCCCCLLSVCFCFCCNFMRRWCQSDF